MINNNNPDGICEKTVVACVSLDELRNSGKPVITNGHRTQTQTHDILKKIIRTARSALFVNASACKQSVRFIASLRAAVLSLTKPASAGI